MDTVPALSSNGARVGTRTAAAPLLAAALLLAAAPASAASLTRGPYLQLLTTNSATVVWSTDALAACSLAIRPLAGGSTQTIEGGAGTVCAIAVSGLARGTQYGYVPRADGVALRSESSFRTDDPSRPFTFLVVGDSGDGGANQLAVRDRMLASPADFILHTGDMIYDNGAAADFDPKFFTPYRDLLRRLVFWPCLGNHDVRTASGQPWRDAFHTPANNPAGSENYYSFDYGNAHVAVLDSNASTSAGSAQHTFLDGDLGRSSARWKFVVFHHTIYSSGDHGSNATIRANLVPLFDKHGVDAVFMGHDHDYERTHPLRAGQIVPAGGGTTYVTTGGGGRSLYPVGRSSFTAYSESAYHFTRVSVDDEVLLLEMVRADGALRDEYGVVKSVAPTATAPAGRTPTPTRSASPGGATPLPTRTATPAGGATPTRTGTPVGTVAPATATPTQGATVTRTAAATRTATVTPRPTATATPFGTPLAPVADTYVEAGIEATWSHGGSDHLDVDVKPFGVTYLRFDLSAQTGTITQALLELNVSNASDDGGRIYRLASSSWAEGTATGIDATSAGADGLKWTDVDVNGDGVLDARDGSPLVPTADQMIASLGPVGKGKTVRADVTAAFQEGPGVYTLAISNSSSDGATFGSRESPSAGLRPVLYVARTSATPTRTVTPASTRTPTPAGTPTATATVGRTATPVPAATATRTATPAPAVTATRTATPVRTATPTATPGGTVTPGRTATPSGTATPSRTATPGATASARATVTPTPAATATPSFSCLLQGGPLVVLSGTLSTSYRNHALAAGSRIDARTAALLGSPTNHYPINLGGGGGACIAGGRVWGQYDRAWSWQAMHDENNAAIAIDNSDFLVDGLRIDNVTDGIRPEGGGPFVVRQSWLTYVRDDCVENDHVQGGLIEDSLFDGCYVGIAERPTTSIIDGGYDGRASLLTIRRTLLRLQPMPGPRGGSATDLGNGEFFKWHDLATRLALHDNVFMAERVSQNGASSMGIPAGKLESCSNNVMVWLGPGSYPAPLPSCFTVTTDRAVWDEAVARWKGLHPHVGGP